MLEPIKHILNNQRIILASSSPRRQEILKSVGINFEVCKSNYEEDLDPMQYINTSDFVIDTACNKVLEVAGRLKAEEHPPDLIIGADTVVSLNGRIFGKPDSEQDAVEFLQALNGKSHTVYTGIILITKSKTVKFYECANVQFGNLSPEIIDAYVKTGEPMDKAGAYGIQGIGGSLIKKIEGDYYTVMGLPLHSLCTHILDLYKNEKLSPDL